MGVIIQKRRTLYLTKRCRYNYRLHFALLFKKIFVCLDILINKIEAPMFLKYYNKKCLLLLKICTFYSDNYRKQSRKVKNITILLIIFIVDLRFFITE